MDDEWDGDERRENGNGNGNGNLLTPEDRQHLESLTDSFSRKNRRRTVLLVIMGVVVFSLYQTAVFLYAAGWATRTSRQSSQELAARVDRNTAFSACVLSAQPEIRTKAYIEGCLREANRIFDIQEPVPTPAGPSPEEGSQQ